MRRNRIMYGIWLISAAVLYLFINGAGSRIILLSSLVIPTASVLTTAAGVRKLKVRIEIGGSCKKGRGLRGKIHLKNEGIFPLFRITGCLFYENLMNREIQREELCVSAGPKEELTLPFELKMRYCGKERIRIDSLKITDLLGLACFSLAYEALTEAVVSPEGAAMELRIAEAASYEESETFSSLKAGKDPSEVFQIREYVPGDSIKQIHWKLSQKIDQLMVREQGLPVPDHVLLLFDSAAVQIPAAARIDSMAELFFSLSKELLDMDIRYSMKWIDNRGKAAAEYDIQDEQTLYKAITDFLGNPFVKNENQELKGVFEGMLQNHNAHVVLVSADYDADASFPYHEGHFTLLTGLENYRDRENTAAYLEI